MSDKVQSGRPAVLYPLETAIGDELQESRFMNR